MNKVTLFDLKQLKTSWVSPLDAFTDAYKHEQFITGKINDLMKIARDLQDYSAEPILNWFISEQIEEESNALKIQEQLKLISDDKNGLLMLDRELGTRVFPAGSPLDPAAYQAAY